MAVSIRVVEEILAWTPRDKPVPDRYSRGGIAFRGQLIPVIAPHQTQ
jgi:chemotaxis signal transduction protein